MDNLIEVYRFSHLRPKRQTIDTQTGQLSGNFSRLLRNDKLLNLIRVMFYYPNREQAIRIQETLATLYAGIGGHYHFGDAAWAYVKSRTEIDLKAILEKLAGENTSK